MGRCDSGVGDGITGFSLSLPRSDTSVLLLSLFPSDGSLPISELLQQQVDRAELLTYDPPDQVRQRLRGGGPARGLLGNRPGDSGPSTLVHVAPPVRDLAYIETYSRYGPILDEDPVRVNSAAQRHLRYPVPGAAGSCAQPRRADGRGPGLARAPRHAPAPGHPGGPGQERRPPHGEPGPQPGAATVPHGRQGHRLQHDPAAEGSGPGP